MLASQRWRGVPRLAGLALTALMPLACLSGRDVAEVAAGVAPFDQLRGMNMTPLRSGAVRAVRRNAEPAPREGLRESLGAYELRYAVTGYDGTDGSWPAEEALILWIEATREWPDDTAAIAAWRGAIREVVAGLAVEPQCARVSGPGFSMRVAEWDRGEGWSLSTSVAPAVGGPPEKARSARHSIAVRRSGLTAGLPEEGQPNPDTLPTWTRIPCAHS